MKFIPYAILLVLSSFLFNNCTKTSEAPLHEINDRLNTQVEMWNSGDIGGYMDIYDHSDSLSFASKNGVAYGWENVLRNYSNAYPDREAMGQLSFKIKEVKAIESHHAFVIGKWKLERTDLSDLSGYFTIILAYKDGDWYIISDHTS